MLLRYPQELVPVKEYTFPGKALSAYRLGKKELEMARHLVDSMSGSWGTGRLPRRIPGQTLQGDREPHAEKWHAHQGCRQRRKERLKRKSGRFHGHLAQEPQGQPAHPGEAHAGAQAQLQPTPSAQAGLNGQAASLRINAQMPSGPPRSRWQRIQKGCLGHAAEKKPARDRARRDFQALRPETRPRPRRYADP